MAGTEKVNPSSPPVRLRHCSARIWAKLATASVIIEKKMARKRKLRSPITAASTKDTAGAGGGAQDHRSPADPALG